MAAEAPTGAATPPDADETSTSPLQPTGDQIAVEPPPSGDIQLTLALDCAAALPADADEPVVRTGAPRPLDRRHEIQNGTGIPASSKSTVEPFSSQSYAVVTSEPGCVEKHDYHTEKAQETILIPDATETMIECEVGVKSLDDGSYGFGMSNIPSSSNPKSQPDDSQDVAIETAGLQSAVTQVHIENGSGLLTSPNSTVEPFSSPSYVAVSSESSCAEKHDYHSGKDLEILIPDATDTRVVCEVGVKSSDDRSYGSGMSRIPLPSNPKSLPNDIVDATFEIGGLKSAVIEVQIENGPSVTTPDTFGNPLKKSLSGGAVSSKPNDPAENDNHTENAQATPVDIVFPVGTETRIRCKEGYQSPELPDGITMATEEPVSSVPPPPMASEDPVSSVPPPPASKASTSSCSMSPHPSSPTTLIESTQHLPSLSCAGQTSSHSDAAPSRETLNAVEESQSAFNSKDHVPLQDYDPVDDSFPTATVQRGKYTGLNFMAAQYPPFQASQIIRSRVQDYCPNDASFQFPHCRQGGRYQGQTKNSSAADLNTKLPQHKGQDYGREVNSMPWLFGDQYPQEEYNGSRSDRVGNRWQRYYAVDDRTDSNLWPHGGQYQGPDHQSSNTNSGDVSQPFEARHQDYRREMNVLDDIAQPHRAGYHKGQDYGQEVNNIPWLFNDQYPQEEYNGSRSDRVGNRWQRYYPVDDRTDGNLWPHGGQYPGSDHQSSNTNSGDVSQPFEARHQDYQREMNGLDDMAQSRRAGYHKGQDYGREVNTMPWLFDDQYPQEEYNGSRSDRVGNRWQRYYPVDDRTDGNLWPHGGQYQGPDHQSSNTNLGDVSQPFEARHQDYRREMNVLDDMAQPRRAGYQRQTYLHDEIYLGEVPQPYGGHYQRQEYRPEGNDFPLMPQSCRGPYQGHVDCLRNNNIDRMPPQQMARYQERGSWSSNDADVQRSQQGPDNCINNASIQKKEASLWMNQYQRPEFAEFTFHDACPTDHELESLHPKPQLGEFKGEGYRNVDFQTDVHERQESCTPNYYVNHDLQSQEDQCSAAESASKDENLSDAPQLTGRYGTTEEKSSSQGHHEVACESGNIVCDNIIIGPNSSKVVVGERNQAGRRSSGRITGNRILR
ncbi:hypothetical protein J5N97_012243 [Dioscorea zingiberensis]|uniref:Uncharacterized protein n=1 Tax=Dioscorea zingiberensis TaxID=325984 RepID=A0A9D5CPD5_9LILI|nr:hypothetical protein J5N97_012243 [Dioscorea zingiberensis]